MDADAGPGQDRNATQRLHPGLADKPVGRRLHQPAIFRDAAGMGPLINQAYEQDQQINRNQQEINRQREQLEQIRRRDNEYY